MTLGIRTRRFGRASADIDSAMTRYEARRRSTSSCRAVACSSRNSWPWLRHSKPKRSDWRSSMSTSSRSMAGIAYSPCPSECNDCPLPAGRRLPSARTIRWWPTWVSASDEKAFHYCPRVSLPSDPSQIYLGGEPVEDESRAAKHRLIREVKRVVDNAALLDVGANDTEGLSDFADEAGGFADRLEQAPSLRAFGGAAGACPAD